MTTDKKLAHGPVWDGLGRDWAALGLGWSHLSRVWLGCVGRMLVALGLTG